MSERAGSTGQNQGGLAEMLLGWWRTSWRVKFRGLRGAQGVRRMELVEVLQLGGRRQLMMVACDGRRYLVGTGGDGVHSIAEVTGEMSGEMVERRVSHGVTPGTRVFGEGAYATAKPPGLRLELRQ